MFAGNVPGFDIDHFAVDTVPGFKVTNALYAGASRTSSLLSQGKASGPFPQAFRLFGNKNQMPSVEYGITSQ
jgi:hypothetical protein